MSPRKLIGLSLVALLQCGGCGFVQGIVDWFSPPRSDATVVYLPLETELAAPVTGDTIENYAGVCRAALSWRSRPADALRKMLRRTVPGTFRGDAVRLKIVGLLDDEVLIDRGGGVRFGPGGKEAQLRNDDLRVLGTLMKRQICREGKASKTRS